MFLSLRRLCKSRIILRTQNLSQFAKSDAIGPTETSKYLVQGIERNNEERMLHVKWKGDLVSRYPYVFLRDNCRCSECFHESSYQRRFDPVDNLDLNILPKKMEVTQYGENLIITWPDGHISAFDSGWLHSRRLIEGRDSKEGLNRKGVEFWDSKKLQGQIPRHDFREVMEEDGALFSWLSSMHKLGVALICNTPLKVGQVDELCQRVGHAKSTHYGHNFEVKTKYGPSNLAYTSDRLPLHMDLPFYDYPPGVQLLHCIEQVTGPGGANQFVDGFHVSKLLKDLDPKKFDLLSSSRLHFFDVGRDEFGDFDMKFERLTIELDGNGQLFRFIYNNHVRDSIMSVSPERAVELYEAYVTLGKMMRDPANQIEYKMAPGDMVTFNNCRVMHGRSEFALTEQVSRFLSGMYMDWDIMYSRLRALSSKLNIPCPCY
ncbi:gamma-butyrobetaine dioxygenase-like [Acropora palmata]|uniref:gamma-butyrobetaine dioxygenase-like n=1 Tax=Acropora palmata TaxID=6131 RepID=UPI003DA0C66C